MNEDQKKILMELRKAAEDFGFAALARETGIPRTHFYRLFSETGNPRMKNLKKIASALKYNLLAEEKP